jgi:branched-chain amino acid aminotransferase
MHSNILHNGSIQHSGQRCLTPGQTGVMNGWGVFSTIRVSRGVLFAYERHWARMRRDAEALRVPMPDDPERFRRDLLRLVEANGAQESTLRVAVIRNRGGAFEGEAIERDFDVVAFTADLTNWEPVRLAVEPHARHSACRFAGAKVLSWSFNLAWLESAKARGFDEVVLLNERGEVAECTSANIFVETDDGFLTPPLSSGCLPGVTRELLLGEARPEGVLVQERALRLEDLYAARAVFVSSTTRDLLRVLSVEGQEVAWRTRLSPILSGAFKAYFDAYIAAGNNIRPG